MDDCTPATKASDAGNGEYCYAVANRDQPEADGALLDATDAVAPAAVLEGNTLVVVAGPLVLPAGLAETVGRAVVEGLTDGEGLVVVDGLVVADGLGVGEAGTGGAVVTGGLDGAVVVGAGCVIRGAATAGKILVAPKNLDQVTGPILTFCPVVGA